jgi:hypothetical protein
MRYLRRHWYNIGLVVGLFAIIALAVRWREMDTLARLGLLNFIVLMVHQFEEYSWPGGFPWIMNEVIQTPSGRPDRFRLNQNSAFFINIPLAWPYYLAPVFFPNILWLGLSVLVLFCIGQFVIHGVVTNAKLKTFYNPGLGAVVVGHIPLGIWYLVELYSTRTVSLWDWVLAAVLMAAFAGIGMVAIGFNLLADRNSPYPFAPEEMERFDRAGHLARIRNASVTRGR